MNNIKEYNERKQKLVNCLKEYVSCIENLSTDDLKDYKKLRDLSSSHLKAAESQLQFSELITTKYKQWR
jgi:hypothetical protein